MKKQRTNDQRSSWLRSFKDQRLSTTSTAMIEGLLHARLHSPGSPCFYH